MTSAIWRTELILIGQICPCRVGICESGLFRTVSPRKHLAPSILLHDRGNSSCPISQNLLVKLWTISDSRGFLSWLGGKTPSSEEALESKYSLADLE